MNNTKLLFYALILIISGCFFGSLSQFSEEDIIGRTNVLSNSGFEEGNYPIDELPKEWLIVNKPLNVVYLDKNVAHQGTRSVKMINPPEKINLFSEAININPQEIYYTKCYVKVDSPVKVPVTLYFLGFTITGKRVDRFSQKIYPKQDWTKIELTAGFFDNSALFGRIAVSVPQKKGVTVWIDDVESYNVFKMRKRWEE
ncbi:MAG: hypothetical protein H8E57_08460 [Candidatus Cloacimonetes bacterium]|nr:hypothetical protein [Candidatus Cloacimonadota bacterium]